MMTPSQLDRGSQAFRRGYRDVYANNQDHATSYMRGSFGASDYAAGRRTAEDEIRLETAKAGRTQ